MLDRTKPNRPLLGATLLACSMISPVSAQAPRVLQVEMPGNNLFGMPVYWGRANAALLEADGKFHLLDVDQVRRTEVLEEDFQPEPLTLARSKLQAEMGKHYETLVSGPYVIATPTGNSKRWKSRFTALLSGYTRYFEVRGWPLRRPDFPLIVIVFSTREEFLRYAAREGSQLIPQAVGGYFPRSNRCVLYQIPGVQGTNWTETEATIVHEAVHQIAYNTGVHERLFDNPLWFVEGLATMFENPNVYDLGAARSNLVTRINGTQMSLLQPLAREPGLLESNIRSLIASDRLFRTDAATAYAVSWGLTFYLSERMPTEYRDFIQLQSRKEFGVYSRHGRERDFQQAFRTDPSMLATQMSRLFSK